MNDDKKTLQHIAIIMDGNGRWAKKETRIEFKDILKQKKVYEIALSVA